MRLAIIGVPYNSAGLTSGEARAPEVLRAAGLVDVFARVADTVDDGDVQLGSPSPDRDPATGIIAPHELAGMVDTVREAVGRAFRDGRVPIVIGGECPLLLGCLAAAREVAGQVGLLFVDGHEDAWPPPASTTGEAADMELGLAIGNTGPTGIARLDELLPLVRAEDVIVLGARDQGELAESEVASLAPIVTFHDETALHAADPGEIVTAIVAERSEPVGGWWLHLDLDVLSTEALPAVRYPQPGGLSWDELERLTAAALRLPGLIGWNITIYNPDLDPERTGAARIVSFLRKLAPRLAVTSA